MSGEKIPDAAIGLSTPTGVVERAPYYQTFYTPNIRMKVSFTDATITFLSVSDSPGGVTNSLREEVSVVMPLAAFKIFGEHIAATVEAIESELGPIRVATNSRPQKEYQTLLIQSLKAVPLGE